MSYSRKYRKPKSYRDGGAVIADDERVDALVPEEPTAAPQPAPASALADQIEAMHETDPWRYQVASWYRHQALNEGIEDDSPEMHERIEQGYRETTAQQRRLGAETARAYATAMLPKEAPPLTAPQAHALASAASLTLPLPEPPPKTRSIPVTAPVTRTSYGLDGRQMMDSNQFNPATGRGKLKLTAEERDIARRSYSAPDMSDAEKEYAYALAKKKMLLMKHSGEMT